MTSTDATFTPAMGYIRGLGWFGGYVDATTVCSPEEMDVHLPQQELEDSLLHTDFHEAVRFSAALWRDQTQSPFADSLLPLWGEDGCLHLVDTRTPEVTELRGRDDHTSPDAPERAFALGAFGPFVGLRWEALVRCPAGTAVGVLDEQVEHRILTKGHRSTDWEYVQHTDLGDRSRALRTAYNLSGQTPPLTRSYRVLREETTLMRASVDLRARVDEEAPPGRGPEPWQEEGVYQVQARHGLARPAPEGSREHRWSFTAYPDFDAAHAAHARDETGQAHLAYQVRRSTWTSTEIGV
ncbi:hypothetical protein [Nocardiopsis synnemataformans]|uniref:hypothetical protein n=1 Tax=Nocardiopsis synnemataformans TaxID=61305 RepID=UPI003EBCA920